MSIPLSTKIYIAGHRGMVGSAILRKLIQEGYTNIILRSHDELDLIDQLATRNFFERERPELVYLAASKVGGIVANNDHPAEFIYENLMVQSNVIHQAFMSGVKRLLFLGSSCIYPKFAPQPICESALLTGLLESTNEAYAVAKIAGIKMCDAYNNQYAKATGLDYRAIMPTNLYGPGDNYHPQNSHVIPGLIRRLFDGAINNESEILIWGTGKPRREFLYVEDMAAAAIFIMNIDKERFISAGKGLHLNVGSGIDISIHDLAIKIAKVVGFKGVISFDSSKPDGTPKKLMNSKRINDLGWRPLIELDDGLEMAFSEFKKEYKSNFYD